MQETRREPSARIIGRESELAALPEFLETDHVLAGFVLTGGPGIGKTTLWEAGIESARKRRLRVLSARPSSAEAQRTFAGLTDLLDEVRAEALSGLPAPQLAALEVAILRAEPAGVPPEPHAIILGFLNALRTLSAHQRVLVAIDDLQWLDRPSADALAFAARRLERHPVRFLLARRPGGPPDVERALEPAGLERAEIGPLSLGAIRRILSERLGLTMPRRLLLRIYESARGNPLFALELARTVAERGTVSIGEEIPLAGLVEDVFGPRVKRLSDPVRRLLLALALAAELRLSQLDAIAGPGAIDEAVDAELLVVEGDRVRPSHPLLAAAARKHSRARERRETHLELSRVVADEELRARHLALATDRPDGKLAIRVSAAAASASRRGVRHEAVQLAEHALRLTPADSTERSERLLALAGYLEAAGEPQRVTDLLLPELESLPPGRPRVRAQLLLAEGGHVKNVHDHEHHLGRALAETQGDPVLRAYVLAKKSIHATACCVERIPEAEAWSLEALRAAPRAGADVERLVLHGLAWARSLRGRAIDDVCERFAAVTDAAFYITDSPDPVAGLRFTWRGEVEQARVVLTRMLSLADERGEGMSYALQRMNLCDLELRAGEFRAASRWLDEWAESSRVLVVPTYERSRALLAAGRGLPDEAERWAASALTGAEAIGVRWQVLEALRARGIAALLAHDPMRAAESLRAVWEHTQREGVEDPGAFPVAPDLVEALVEGGELEEAQAVTDRLRGLAEEQEHPWGRATARRCGALLRLTSPTYDAEAEAALEQAVAAYETLGLRFDRARSLLSLGRAGRRLKKWGAARRSLERATAAFDEIGAIGWREEARSELDRVGARRPARTGELTRSERRVVELAAEGVSNKEIARTLFVSVHTIEVHLSHAYVKLGVRSRGQLARRLSTS